MTLRRNHYKPRGEQKVTEENWIDLLQASFAAPALCGRRGWGAATDKLEDVDCKSCLRLINEARRELEHRRARWREAEQANLELFQKAAYVTRIFRPRRGQA